MGQQDVTFLARSQHEGAAISHDRIAANTIEEEEEKLKR
jgi:hypothetical protein